MQIYLRTEKCSDSPPEHELIIKPKSSIEICYYNDCIEFMNENDEWDEITLQGETFYYNGIDYDFCFIEEGNYGTERELSSL